MLSNIQKFHYLFLEINLHLKIKYNLFEVIQDRQIKLNFESKRDRWNGYEANLYNKEVVKKWQTEEQLLESNKKKQMELKLANNEKA